MILDNSKTNRVHIPLMLFQRSSLRNIQEGSTVLVAAENKNLDLFLVLPDEEKFWQTGILLGVATMDEKHRFVFPQAKRFPEIDSGFWTLVNGDLAIMLRK